MRTALVPLRNRQTGNAEAVAKIKKAAQRAMNLRGIVETIRRSGITSVRAIADEFKRPRHECASRLRIRPSLRAYSADSKSV
jgi:hypothetical protein